MDNNQLSAQDNRNEWMIVYVTHELTDAHIVEGRLKSEGIMAFIDHMLGRSAIGITFGTWGEVRVLVHPKDYERASILLYPDEPDALPDGDEDIIYYSGEEYEYDDDDE